MRNKEIEKFFNPKSIAVIGASDDKEKVGYALMSNLMKFRGKIIPINIKREKVFGKTCWKSVLDYPDKIDLSIIAIPKIDVKLVLKECGEKGIGNVIIISAGFSETGNKESEVEIVEIAKRYGISLLGPNCFGVCNPAKRLNTTFSDLEVSSGEIAFISQSGALWSFISSYSLGKFGFSGFVSLGNMADLSFEDFIEFFENDRKTKKIILYVEKLKNGKKFIETCRKCRKEIIAVKSGSSNAGVKAGLSHTGSLASDFEIYKGAFKQAGVLSARTLEAAFNYARLKVKGKKVYVITNAGGAGALFSDYASSQGLGIVNVVDVIGTAKAGDYRNAFNKIKRKNSYDCVAVIFTRQTMSEADETAKEIVKFARKKAVVACFLGGEDLNSAREILESGNVPCVSLQDAADVLSVGI